MSAAALAGTAPAPRPFGYPFSHELEVRRARFLHDKTKPQAAVPLIGLLDLWDKLSDRMPLVNFLDEVLASQAQPEVKARAVYLRALVADRLGKTEEATGLRKQLGLVDRFVVTGPFDNEGKAGHETVFGPEEGRFDEKASFSGKDRKLGWRVMPDVVTQGIVNLEAFCGRRRTSQPI